MGWIRRVAKVLGTAVSGAADVLGFFGLPDDWATASRLWATIDNDWARGALLIGGTVALALIWGSKASAIVQRRLTVQFDPAKTQPHINKWHDRRTGIVHAQYRFKVVNETGRAAHKCRGFIERVCEQDGVGSWKAVYSQPIPLTWAIERNITEWQLNSGEDQVLNSIEVLSNGVIGANSTHMPGDFPGVFHIGCDYVFRVGVYSDETRKRTLYMWLRWTGDLDTLQIRKIRRPRNVEE